MRRVLLILLATIMLLCVVACKNDPNLYKYDSSSYLGSWEIDIAPIEGDVDGCIQLVQYTFNEDFTYEVTQYWHNAETNIITIVLTAPGVYDYDFDEDTGIGTLTLDGGPTEYYWSMSTGKLFTKQFGTVGIQYDFKRPKYIVKKAANQKDIIGVWEHTVYNKNTWGKDTRQLEFKSDGTLDTYIWIGVGNPVNHSDPVTWKYKVADQERSYSRTYHTKWEYGSEVVVTGPSSVLADLHGYSNHITEYNYTIYVDNGVWEQVDDLPPGPTDKKNYAIYQYGDKYILVYDGLSYVKASNHIDMSIKNKEIVHPWTAAPTFTLYLRSDGTYSSDYADLFNYSQLNADDYYSGTYSTSYNEVATADYVAFERTKYEEEHPGEVPVGGWDAWTEAQIAYINTLKEDNTVQLFTGTITFRPDFGYEETFKFFMIISTPKYGIEDHNGEPDPSYSLCIRNTNNEGDINYLDLD